MEPSKAQETVFSIPELFSGILQHLPLGDLLLSAPLVNHSWHHLIASSNSLRARLFFHPRPHNSHQKPETNPFLKGNFHPWFHNRPIDYIHPVQMFTSLPWSLNKAKTDAYLRKDASWRRMLPAQPPARSMEIVKFMYHGVGQVEQRGELRFEDGVRMGTLYDLAFQTVFEPLSSFWISWHMFPDMDCQDFGWGCLSEDDESETEGDSRSERITFNVSWTEDGDEWLTDRLGSAWRSLGHENLDLALSKEVQLPWDPNFEPTYGDMWNSEHANRV